MIRLAIIALILFILFIAYMHIRDEHYTKEQRRKALLTGLTFIAVISILIVVLEYTRRWQLHDDLIAANFEEVSEGSYETMIDSITISLKYESGYEPEQSVPRLVFEARPDQPFTDITSLFCDDAELKRYQTFNYGRRYPTPEIKLPNGHFVGKCYPQSIIDKVANLGVRSNDFTPTEARYLFLPSAREQEHVIRFYTENLDTVSLRARLEELLEYYKIVSGY